MIRSVTIQRIAMVSKNKMDKICNETIFKLLYLNGARFSREKVMTYFNITEGILHKKSAINSLNNSYKIIEFISKGYLLLT